MVNMLIPRPDAQSPSETPPAANVVAQPTIAFPAASPHYSRNNSLVISGMCVTGQIVQLSGSDSAQQTCAAAAYSFSVTKTIDGFYSYFITQMNSIDNNYCEKILSLQIRIPCSNTLK